VTPDPGIEGPLRFGVLGTARVAPQALLQPAGRSPGVAVEVIAARSRDRALAFASAHAIPRAHGSYAELLADDRIDAVYVALPTALHGEWVQRALEAGKHVLCEKPLAATAAAARELAAVARKRGRVLQEALQVVYHPGLRRVRELVAEGRAGRAVRVESCFRIPRVPMAPGDFRMSYELGGGAALDLGCYAAACLRYVTGAEPEVIRARARLAGPRVDRWMRAECVLDSGLSARLECGFRGWYRRRLGVKVSCERGWIEWTQDGLAYQAEGKVVREDVPGSAPYDAQLADFVGRCRGAPPSGRTLEDSVSTLVVVDAMYEHAGLAPRPSTVPVPA
jgi:predicted dehydrogenase